MEKWVVIKGINPQPWAIGPLEIGRNINGVYPKVGPNRQLLSYQQAISEELAMQIAMEPFSTDVEVKFFFWRQLDSGTVGGKQRRAHQADVTNLQKALEDALQGFMFKNDRQVRSISSTIIEQEANTKSCIVICVKDWDGFNPDCIPTFVWNLVDAEQGQTDLLDVNTWQGEDVF